MLGTRDSPVLALVALPFSSAAREEVRHVLYLGQLLVHRVHLFSNGPVEPNQEYVQGSQVACDVHVPREHRIHASSCTQVQQPHPHVDIPSRSDLRLGVVLLDVHTLWTKNAQELRRKMHGKHRRLVKQK